MTNSLGAVPSSLVEGTRRVLVVDDNPVILDLLVINFELEGFVVLRACNGVEALSLARQERPDVVVSDVRMPMMDGLDLISAMRDDVSTAGIPVVLVSAEAQASDVERGLHAGAAAYITKPFDPFDLIETVRDLLVAQRQ